MTELLLTPDMLIAPGSRVRERQARSLLAKRAASDAAHRQYLRDPVRLQAGRG